PLEPPTRLDPPALEVRLGRLPIQPVDLRTVARGVTEPDPPERVTEARQPGTRRQRQEEAPPARREHLGPDEPRHQGHVRRRPEQGRQDQTENLLTRPDLRQARPDAQGRDPEPFGHAWAPSLSDHGSPSYFHNRHSKPPDGSNQANRIRGHVPGTGALGV